MARRSKWMSMGNALARAGQIVFALTLMLLLAPLMTGLFIAVILDSGFPFLYRGRRIGLGGSAYWMYKIRTLHEGAETKIGASLLNPNDGHVTRMGRFLRDTKLDELPQLINVLKGEMNFVGPRPVRPVFYDEYIDRIPRYAERFRVRPGVTGLAQIRGKYESSPEEKLRYELEFIENDGLRLRLRIVGETVWLLLANLFSPKFSNCRLAKTEARRRRAAAQEAEPELAAAEFVGEA
ncbi:MAG: sugar transferase [Candidatus Sumerlaeota bacterium]|nr:sugar transferase [Candidatus Sumerlaeota bacterium]